MESDLEIARKAKLRPIADIANELGIPDRWLEPYGRTKAKVDPRLLKDPECDISQRPEGKLIDITAITPTPLGEGKTVNTIGLALGLNHIGKRAFVCMRQPSLGPVFGIKGGAAGGGYSQVVPMEDINLHLTGDIHAVSIAHNLGAAFLDNHYFRQNRLKFDPAKISWKRVVDVNDRALRDIVIGLGEGGPAPRQTGYDISVASELMAVLALAEDIHDLRTRVGRIVVAIDTAGEPVTMEQIGCAGAMTVLLRDALKPNLMQTIDGTPAFVHCGPFANIAHGNSSIIADRIALRLSDYVVTESGFGADMGFEKFMNIKCRIGKLKPAAVGLVATVRALKMHSGKYKIVPGKPLDPRLGDENVADLDAGCANLVAQIETVKKHGLQVVVAVNRFPGDHDSETKALKRAALDAGAFAAVSSEVFMRGGAGGAEFADAIVQAANAKSDPHPLYALDIPIKDKIKAIATEVYGAKDVAYEKAAEDAIRYCEARGWGNLPICMAKTHLSLSDDASKKGAPKGYTFKVRDLKPSIGAGFLYALCGTMMTMPGLGSEPGGCKIDIDADGEVVGLS